MPTTLLGLAVLFGALSPGFIYLRRVEKYELRPSRSASLEAAEILVTGGAATILAGLLLTPLTLFLERNFVRDWIEMGSSYFTHKPFVVVGWSLCLMVLSHVLAYGWARVVTGSSDPDLFPGSSAWTRVLRPGKEIDTYCSVKLDDGRVLTGYVAGFDLQASESGARDLALQRPIFERLPNSEARTAPNVDFVIIDRLHIHSISGAHFHHNTRKRVRDDAIGLAQPTPSSGQTEP